MAFFNRLPNIEYDTKPIQFPFSETQYVLAKNFFKRYKLSESSYNYKNFFTEYFITDNDRIDYLSHKFYDTSEFDWIILITNNIINTNFDLPVKEDILYDMVNKAYLNFPGSPQYPADRIHHYETLEFKNNIGEIVLKSGLNVNEFFFTSAFKYCQKTVVNNQTICSVSSVPGNTVSRPVTNYEYEKELNDKKRLIYILRPEFIQDFIDQYESGMEYKSSSSFVDNTTKRSGI